MSGMSATTGKLIGEDEHIRQCVRDIVFTPLGSRLMRRDYGSRLPFLIGSSEADTVDFVAAVTEALAKHEPRIEVLQTSVYRVVEGTLRIMIEARRVHDGRPLRLEI